VTSCNVEKSFGYNISVLVLLVAAFIASVTQTANSAMTIEPSTDMVAIPYYYILSINGINVDHLLSGTTTFGDEHFILDCTPESCDDFNLRSVADAIYQPWVETNFGVPVETIFIVEAGGADSGYMQPLDANGVAMEDPIPFSRDSFANTGIGSRAGEAAVLAVITLDPMAYGIRILPPDNGSMSIDLLSVSAVPVGGPVPPPPQPTGTLSEALDTTLDFTTSGNADWFYQVTTSYHDGDAAQSGSILDEQDSRMQTTVNGPGTLSFWWKVSSHPSWDWLEFYVDGFQQDQISGSQGWHQMAYVIPCGSHTLEWRYTKDNYATFGWDCGWVDKVEWMPDSELPPPPLPPSPTGTLSEALDTTLDFTTSGNADWFYQITTSYNDGDAAQSGSISHKEDSRMRTTVNGPGTLSFWWKVSSEPFWDWLGFYVDGFQQDRIGSSWGWHQMTYAIPSGSHTLEWRYKKDGSVSSGSDCGWVDKVEWTPR
jgi:hypothetical protein